MRGWAWIGSVVLLAACTRDNGAFDGSAGGGTASTTGGGAETTRTDGVDGPPPGTGSASGADGSTADDAPPPTTGPEGTSEAVTTMPPEDTTTGSLEEGTTSSVMEEGGSSTTGFDDPITCCMGESCNAPDIADDCVCIQAPECCGPDPWNLYCTAVATQGCGLMCVPPPGDCCEAHEGSPGCGDFEVMACVCSADGDVDCCSIGWTDACAAYAAKECMSCG